MEIEFDPSKNALNIEKHGVPLTDAIKLEWEYLLAKKDDRNDYNEVRMIGYAPILTRVYCVVFTDRGKVRRVISLRKANKREVIFYANQI